MWVSGAKSSLTILFELRLEAISCTHGHSLHLWAPSDLHCRSCRRDDLKISLPPPKPRKNNKKTSFIPDCQLELLVTSSSTDNYV